MRDGLNPRSKAFTLVELLVVIAIIAILISILLPVILKVRRKGIVLASPIVFYTLKDNSLRLTDPTLSLDLKVFSESGDSTYRHPGGVTWSPSGQKLGFEVSNWGPGGPVPPQYIVILNPLTGQMIKHPQMPGQPRSYFAGWADDAHFIESASPAIFVRNADTGNVVQEVPRDLQTPGGPYYRMPVGSSHPYIASFEGAVRLVGHNFHVARTIWQPIDTGSVIFPRANGGDFPIDVDAMGEWVAWTMEMDGGGGKRTAIKRLMDPAEVQPVLLKIDGWFLQWSDHGQLLFITADSGLALVDKSGNIVRKAYIVEKPYNNEGSWRRWGHR